MTTKSNITTPYSNSISNSKGTDKMDTKKPVFDLNAARTANTGWDPTKFVTDYCSTLEEAKASQKPVKYIMGNDGYVYEMRSTELGDFVVKTDSVNGADSISEGLSLKIPKIPFKLLLQAVSFFRDVCDQFNNDEAMLQYWYDKETKEFFAECLDQTTNKVHVTFLRNKELEEDPNKILVMDIHSHNNMNAFFSGTDDASEQETRTYGVIGKLDKEIPEYKFRISVEGKFKEISVAEVFEMPTVKIYSEGFESEGELEPANLFFPNVEFPQEWLDIVEEGKRSKAKFAGKGNAGRQHSTRNHVGSGGDRYFPYNPEDPFVDNRQMSIFSANPDRNYQMDSLRSREGFGFVDNPDDRFVDEEEEFAEVDRSQFDDFVETVVESLELLEDDSELRVEMLSRLVSNFTMTEVQMLVDRMLEIGYDEQIIEQLKQTGYKVSRR